MASTTECRPARPARHFSSELFRVSQCGVPAGRCMTCTVWQAILTTLAQWQTAVRLTRGGGRLVRPAGELENDTDFLVLLLSETDSNR